MTLFLHSVPPPVALITSPPLLLIILLILGFTLLRFVLGIASTLIPQTVPQNLPHYCKFVIFILVNVVLDLGAYVFTIPSPRDIDTTLISVLIEIAQLVSELSIHGW